MARPRAIDVLFEFDAPQAYQDLSTRLSPRAPDEHDVWFDQIHPQHSKPSADLAREAVGAARKLQKQAQQHKDGPVPTTSNRWSEGKENRVRRRTGEYGQTRQKQLKLRERKKHASLEEMRARADEPFQLESEPKNKEFVVERRRKPLGDARNRLNVAGSGRTLPSSEKKIMRHWQELLKRHNKKFKAVHTYEPPQHSVREVKQVGHASYLSVIVVSSMMERTGVTLWYCSGNARRRRRIMPCQPRSACRQTRRLQPGSNDTWTEANRRER